MKGKSDGQHLFQTVVSVGDSRCPKCKVRGVVRHQGRESYVECPKCGRKIGNVVVRT